MNECSNQYSDESGISKKRLGIGSAVQRRRLGNVVKCEIFFLGNFGKMSLIVHFFAI